MFDLSIALMINPIPLFSHPAAPAVSCFLHKIKVLLYNAPWKLGLCDREVAGERESSNKRLRSNLADRDLKEMLRYGLGSRTSRAV